MSVRHLHLHGFASTSQSVKGQHLADCLRPHGVELERPDLNQPSFQRLTYGAALAHLDGLLEGAAQVRMSGSSMGGYLAARWAELNPGRVDRLLLLAPGFDLPNRWPEILGEPMMSQWERDGSIPLPDRKGDLVPIHWGFIEDARRHPAFPEVSCPTVIIHGRADVVVPISSSRAYAKTRDHVRLIEADDVHTLEASSDLICATAIEHLVGSS